MPFRVFEHTADVGLAVEAPDLAALFADAARGLFSVVRGNSLVARQETHTIDVTADRLDRLFLEFLEAFIFLQDAEGLVFADVSDVTVRDPDGAGTLRATAIVWAEPFSHERHPGCLHVKAVTRHELQVAPPQGAEPARARVILDI